MLSILGVPVDGRALPFFDRESGLDPQDLRGFRPCLVKLPQLRVGGGQPQPDDAQITTSAAIEVSEQCHVRHICIVAACLGRAISCSTAEQASLSFVKQEGAK